MAPPFTATNLRQPQRRHPILLLATLTQLTLPMPSLGGLAITGLDVIFAGDTHVNPLVSQGGTFSPGTPYNLTAESYSYNTGSNFIGGGTLGCNLEFPQRYGYLTGLVIGAEGEGGSFGVSNSSVDPNSNHSLSDTSEKTNLGGWDAIAAGRVGAAFDRTFIYGKFGAVFGEANTTITDGSTTPPGTGTINAHGHQNIADAAIGGGIEYALNHSWSVKGEYMYLDTTDSYLVCGAGGGTASGSTFCSSHSLEGTHTFKIGLNYHFDDLFGDSRSGTEPRW
jgi:opacity protein-like surface antigen